MCIVTGTYEDIAFNALVVSAEHGILTSPEAAVAMSKVDRKIFVPDSKLAYHDAPQVIGNVLRI